MQLQWKSVPLNTGLSMLGVTVSPTDWARFCFDWCVCARSYVHAREGEGSFCDYFLAFIYQLLNVH